MFRPNVEAASPVPANDSALRRRKLKQTFEDAMDNKQPNTSPTVAADCSTAHSMRMTRIALAADYKQRQRAVAMFPLMVVGIANDLNKFVKMRDQGVALSADANEAMQYLEDKIRETYRKCFWAELGQ